MLAMLLFAADLEPADLVVTHAKIWSDGQFLKGDSIAVRYGRIIYVGPYSASFVWKTTKIVDAHGRMVIPGLIDCHTHLGESGSTLMQLRLREVKNRPEFVARIADKARELQTGAWLLGSGWSTESWPDPAQPRKEWIDRVTDGHPMCLTRMDGHSVFVNSEALKMAKITRDGPLDPPGGVIERDPKTHEPTGVLRDTAMVLIRSIIPPVTDAVSDEGLRLAIREANQHGLTTVCDIASGFAPYMRAYEAGNRSLRFFLFRRTGDGPWAPTIAEVKRFEGVPGFVEAKGLKAYMDGSMGSRTAFMHAPYTNPGPTHDKSYRGVERPGATNGNYAQGIALAAKNHLQVVAHAIGDQANHDIIDLYEKNAPGLSTRRFRVEHAQHLLPSDVARFGRLGVIPSMQPLHKADDGRYAEEVVGVQRCRTSYAYKSLLSTGARIVFGSDWPVVSLDPFQGIAAAVTGRTMKGDIWFPEQNISVNEALKSYTSRAAYSFFEEGDLGQIKRGYCADFEILSASPFDRKVDIGKIHPLRLFVNGQEVVLLPAGSKALILPTGEDDDE